MESKKNPAASVGKRKARNMSPSSTWRRILMIHGPGFLTWLTESGRERAALLLLANQLSEFLINEIDGLHREWPDAPLEFWRQIPAVRACCFDPGTFEKPLAVQAYAYVHLLWRYRRTWAALKYLSEVSALPLAIHGVRVLDVGAGPGSSLYAIDDFYRSLTMYAKVANIPELQLPEPELNCIERSQSMVWFFERFSQFCGRTGPYGPTFTDFAGLNLRGIRMWHKRQREVEERWDPEVKEYEEIYDPGAAVEYANALFRYRIVIFCNFLTLEPEVEQYQTELRFLFQDLNPGAVVMIVGGTGGQYQLIYKSLAELARANGLIESEWRTDALGRTEVKDYAAFIIKESQHRIYQKLERLVGANVLPKGRDWPDYWNAAPSPKARPGFGLRIFRRGRWPKQ